ncbi:Transposable element P transposase, partial [Aphis craccivora]
VFSDSVSEGLKFYREHQKITWLQGSQETEKFTRQINRAFDALNRKYTAEGIRKNSAYM